MRNKTWRMRGGLLGVVALVGVILAACGPREDTTPPPGSPQGTAARRLVIGVVPKGATHNFWKAIHAGALRAAEEVGGVEIVWKSGIKEDDRDSQIQVVENMVIRRVDGLVLAPLDDSALRPPVQDAVSQGIPVVIIDSDLKYDQYTSFVATDNAKGGERAGKQLGELLGGQGRVVMLRCMEGSASTIAREEGFLRAIQAFPNIQVLVSNRYGGATAEQAYKTSENILAPYRQSDGSLAVDGIFTSNESTTFGMLRALQDSGWAGRVTFVGFDSSSALVKALENGELHGLVLQDPMSMGYLGVKTVVAHLRGGRVDRRIDTGSAVATRDNMLEPAIHALLEPDTQRWLEED